MGAKERVQQHIKDGNPIEKNKKDLFEYLRSVEEEPTPERIFDIMVNSRRDMCHKNFEGLCMDDEGEGLCEDREAIEEVLGKKNLTCRELCEKGLCAKVNSLTFGCLHQFMFEDHNF